MGRPSGSCPHGVQHELGPAGAERFLAFHERESRPTHGLDAGADTEPQLAGCDAMGQLDCGGEGRSAEPVDAYTRVRRRGIRRPARPSGDVTHSFVRGVDTARGDLLDVTTLYADPLDGSVQCQPEEVVGTNMRQRTAVTADRRAGSTEDQCGVTRHLFSSCPMPCAFSAREARVETGEQAVQHRARGNTSRRANAIG